MQRTQIYLSERETAALDNAARATGRNRSQLIREAIRERYGAGASVAERLAVLKSASGAWVERDSSAEEYVDAIRRPGLADRLTELWGEHDDADTTR